MSANRGNLPTVVKGCLGLGGCLNHTGFPFGRAFKVKGDAAVSDTMESRIYQLKFDFQIRLRDPKNAQRV